jgi:hypothetical protein
MADPFLISPDLRPLRHPIAAAPRLIRPFALALTLGYFHHYTPARLTHTPAPAAVHLCRLSAWHSLHHPPGRRALRRHRPLALQLALLHAAGLIDLHASTIAPTPTAAGWLRASLPDQCHALLDALDDTRRWADHITHLCLTEAIPDHFAAWAGQFLRRAARAPVPPPAPAVLRHASPHWQLRLHLDTPPDLLFDLLQIGRWQPLTRDGGYLTITSRTIAHAIQHGRGPEGIRHALEAALRQPLEPQLGADLHHWTRAARAYRLHTACILETTQDDHLQAVYSARRFRPYTLRRLSPRHAVVDPAIRRPLEKWLATRGFALDTSEPVTPTTAAAPAPAYDWLALRVLLGLGDLVPLPVPPPHDSLAAAATHLSPPELSRLEEIARRLLDDLRAAIRGRDAFFPAAHAPDPALLQAVHNALRHGRPLLITYQTLGDPAPRLRRIRPHSLEQRGELYYLRAYCYLAEAELTFRLDRVTAIE